MVVVNNCDYNLVLGLESVNELRPPEDYDNVFMMLTRLLPKERDLP